MEWEPRFLIGIEDIDAQHRQIFSLFQRLTEVSQESSNFNEVLQILQELTSFATEHFEAEETLMRETHFPDYLPHANEHLEFKEKVLQFCKSAIEDSSAKFLSDLVVFIQNWLENHLLKMDMAYVEHIKRKKINDSTFF